MHSQNSSDCAGSIQLRFDVGIDDLAAVRNMAHATGFFRPDEIEIAVELVQARLDQGAESGYSFILAEVRGHVAGYACFGPIGCTIGSYDLYWIIVDPGFQQQGIGRTLLQETERLVQLQGGRRIYIETSNRPQYLPTRGFYLKCGYAVDAILKDYYADGDDKVVLSKAVDRE